MNFTLYLIDYTIVIWVIWAVFDRFSNWIEFE